MATHTVLRLPSNDPPAIASQLTMPALPVHVRSPVLAHSPMSRHITDAVYNRYAYDKEKRQALEAWEERLAQLLAHKPPRALMPAEAA